MRGWARGHAGAKFLALSVSDAAEDVIAWIPGRGPRLRDQDRSTGT
jgi:hypothetical protein